MSFTFKQFHVDDDQCAMKVGTDSILLGAMATIAATGVSSVRVLDIGCGCGLLSLMIAQRIQGEGQITGVEIDAAAARQAEHNIAQSPWPTTIDVVQLDINQYAVDQCYDLVISNPPYFIDSLLGPSKARNSARHTQGLSQSQLLANAARLLAEQGLFWLILPVNEAEQLMNLSEQAGLYLHGLCRVRTRKEKPVHRYIMSFAKFSIDEVAQSDIGVYDEKNQYSRQFIALTRNFYLNR